MNFLVTGGAGFIGSHLVEALLREQHKVVVFDNFSTGSIQNLDAIKNSPSLEIVRGDIVSNRDLLEQNVRECDCVIHLAAAVGVDLVVKEPEQTIITNLIGTENAVSSAAKLGKRFFLASTSEVYGKSTKESFSEQDDLLIGAPIKSRWSYACSKLIDEFLLLAHHRKGNLRGTVTRFFNTVGPRQIGNYGMVLPRFVNAALRDEPLRVFGDGRQSRCFCHVFDVVTAILLLLETEESAGKIFNIGGDELISITDLAKKVIKQTNSKSEIVYVTYDNAYEDGFEDMVRRKPDTTALRSVTGWKPRYNLEKIIDDVVGYFRQNDK